MQLFGNPAQEVTLEEYVGILVAQSSVWEARAFVAATVEHYYCTAYMDMQG